MTDKSRKQHLPDAENLDSLMSGLPAQDREELRRTWDVAGAAREQDLDPESVEHALAKVKAQWASHLNKTVSGNAIQRLTWAMLQAAALLAIGIWIGVALGDRTDQNDVTPAADTGEQSEYLILIRNDGPDPSIVANSELVVAFEHWAGVLAASGSLIAADELKETGHIVLASQGGPTYRDLELTDSSATGFFVIRAATYEEAAAIAGDCPWLAYGGSVELREIVER